MMDAKAAQIIAEVYVINLDGSSLFFFNFQWKLYYHYYYYYIMIGPKKQFDECFTEKWVLKNKHAKASLTTLYNRNNVYNNVNTNVVANVVYNCNNVGWAHFPKDLGNDIWRKRP